MKILIREPAKIDKGGRVISDPKIKPYRWRLNIPASITGTRKERRFFASLEAAKKHRDDLLENWKAAGPDTLRRLAERGMSVTDALEFALKHAPKVAPITFAAACPLFIASRTKANCKARYIGNLESQLLGLNKRFAARMVHDITPDDLDRWLGQLRAKDGKTPANPKTRNNYIITLRAFFNHAVDRGWRGTNPAEKLIRATEDESDISILSPNQVSILLDEAQKPEHAEVFPAMLLQLFAAPRRSELMEIGWEHLIGKYLRLDKTKVRRKRAVEMSDSLLAWLAPFRANAGPIFAAEGGEDGYTYRVSLVAKNVKMELSKNVLRHTAISMRVAATGDMAKTSLWAGSAPKTICEHYLGIVTPEDAAIFYSLGPTVGSNVVPINAAAS
jgi:site-specific recombinase XerD